MHYTLHSYFNQVQKEKATEKKVLTFSLWLNNFSDLNTHP